MVELRLGRIITLLCVLSISCSAVVGSSQNIPDDVVSTEVKKTLVDGTTGILRCTFKGDPNEVYWMKTSGPAKSPFKMTWRYGKKSGPRYEDGSCDIDGNYSLVFRNVRFTDAGRYICKVSNYKGIQIFNHTDVTITNSAMRTEQSVAVQKGEVGVVPCHVNIRPRRVSWVRGANDTLVSMNLSRSVVERSGPGYEEGLFNITSEYSLVINDVRILHEGSYFCEVTDFDTGRLFRNVTGLNVFALPLEPFPSIEECLREQQDLSPCTLRIASQISLTCEVKAYYPFIDLFFMHGSLRVDPLETRVWNNSDGTINKRVTIAPKGSSETFFECVARGLVGGAESRSMTIHLIRDVQQIPISVAILVPVILVFTSILTAVYIVLRWKRQWKRKYIKISGVHNVKQRDLISYIELWTLVKYAREQNLSNKLENVIDKLTIDDCTSKTLQTDEDYYQEFCQWKARYTGTSQKEDFVDACRNAGFETAIDKLQKYSDSTRAVSADDLEHTLWNIAESDRIIGLLMDLGAPHEQIEVLKDNGKREVVEGAMNILKQWRDVNSSGNQEVMISLALETIKYSPCDDDFFRIPEFQKRGLHKDEIHTFILPQITSRHCTELVNALAVIINQCSWNIKESGLENRDVWIDNIIQENRTALFVSHQMIEDWWAQQNCSNYEKRCRLRHAANVVTGRTDDIVPQDARKESDKKWPNTKKLKQIAKLIPQQSMIQLCRTLHIPCTPEDLDDEEKRLEAMCRWRYNMAEQKQERKYKLLSAALKAIDFNGLLSRPKGKVIYKAELVDVALDLIMEDFRPFAEALGISEIKFTSYRQDFRASHLGLGTMHLVLQLFKSTDSGSINKKIRGSFPSILDKAGYQNVMKRFRFAFEPSYGELLAIATAVLKDDETKIDVEFTETNEDKDFKVVKEPVDDIENEIKSKTVLREKDAGDLQRMLELTDEDIPDCNMASVPTILKSWKESVCPGLLDHRVVLAEGLHKINKPQLVPAVINGRYQSRETSIDFIEDMLGKMDGSRRTSLERLLKSKQDKTKRLQSSDMTSQWICDWVAYWIKDTKGTTLLDCVLVMEATKRHRDFNDKLVDNGFLDLAREIMNIEQVL